MPQFRCHTLIALSLAAAIAGCGTSAESTSTPQSSEAPAPVAIATHHTAAHHRSKHTSRPKRSSRPKPRSHSGSGLVTSTASGHQIQPQQAAGSCHASGQGQFVMPDPHCTPGALNPAVTQATIDRTICVPGYTKTIRPSESITEPEKLASMAAYGYSDRSPSDFEYDHLVSLELGGAVNDPRNLWPESGASPNPKDSVENALHHMVCDGRMSLGQAQHIIATDWLGWGRSHGVGSASPSATVAPAAPTPPTQSSMPSGPNKPVSEVNCSDFSTHAAAQQWFTAHGGSASNDVAGLDGDHDGQACESLP
jgi:excalibur calcium-binding domain-containing protein